MNNAKNMSEADKRVLVKQLLARQGNKSGQFADLVKNQQI